MVVEIEQRVYTKFYVKPGKSATETLEMLRKVFGEHSLAKNYVIMYHITFFISNKITKLLLCTLCE
jgi:hypothetical protein